MADLVLLRLLQFGVPSFVALSVGVGFTRIDAWYRGLWKPDWTPPGRMIAAIWWAIFAMLSVAMALAWEAGPADALAWAVLGAWLANLGLNAAWPYLFFTRRNVEGALREIGVLWVSVLVLAILAALRTPEAGLLLLPYLAWVGIAGYLNLEILRGNRSSLVAISA